MAPAVLLAIVLAVPADAGQASALQPRIDAAAAGATLEIGPGRYDGDLVIDRPLRLVGRGRPLLVGSGKGSVVRIRASDVTLEGFDIDGLGGGLLADDPAGIHVSGARAVVRDCRVRHALLGVYLHAADAAVVEGSTVTGYADRPAGEQGSGIHVWNTQGFRLVGNEVRFSRDGFYIQSSNGGFIGGNLARDVRYGLHYMSSDDNVFEDNRFEQGAAGAAIMYSKRITFRRNQFLHSRGFGSVGLLLQACEDVTALDNLIADNGRGIFLEGTLRSRFAGNIIARSDTAVVLYDSAREVRFEGNAFLANLSPLDLVGRRTDTSFDRNYWSDATEPDFDGDGIGDAPYRLTSVFDHLRGNLTAADLFARSLTAAALGLAERTFPVLSPAPVADLHPLARPPGLPNVPRPEAGVRQANVAGLIASAASAAFGAVLLLGGRRRRAHGGTRREAA
jgi:nitrous oxidase accessory protein